MSSAVDTRTTTTTTTTDAVTVSTVDAKAFAGLLTDVALFASKDQTLPALCAVQLQRGTVDGKPVIVARSTDRYALAESWIRCDGGTPWPEATVLIPLDGIKQILGVLKSTARGGMAIVTVTKDSRGVRITVDNFSAQATVYCTDACFPTCASLWPTDSHEPPVVRTFGPTVMARPAAVAKRRGEPLRVHWDGKRSKYSVPLLMTAGPNIRMLIMTLRDETGDACAYELPVYK